MIREKFVQETLETEGASMLRFQGTRIEQATTRRTGHLKGARRITVTGGEGMDGRLEFTHTDYERFLDIKRARKGGKRRRSRKIHNRYVFGAYASIAKRLMYGLTEEVASDIRRRFVE